MDMSHLPPVPTPIEASEADVEALLTPLEESPLDIEELEDGSAIIHEPHDEEAEQTEFDANLAETLEETVLAELGHELVELVEADKEARKQRDEQYAEGIRRTGLGNDAPGGADFDGASRAVHPMLAKACVDFASRAIKELYPANGPVKTQIIGKSTEDKLDKAERKKTYMNWQLTKQVSENRAAFEQLLSQLPLGGAQYKRWWYDSKLERNRTETVYIDDVFIPYDQADFYTARRVTHRQYIDSQVYQQRIDSGLYRDLALIDPPIGDKSLSSKATDKVEGAEEDDTAYNEEGLREIYMVYADVEVEGDEKADGTAPYIIHVDKASERVLGVFRNWDEDDEKQEKLHWMVEYDFIPWRGGRGIGLAHLIGSLSGAATGALRALLDSAHIKNFPGGLKLKGGRSSGESVQVNATELAEIEVPPGVNDIRQAVMPFPFNEPSQVLFNLLDWMTGQAESVVSVANEKIADSANMPMGTALALIEHGSVNFSAIHSRLHASLAKELEIVHRLNGDYLDDEETIEELGELVVSRDDFTGPMDIIPVSDPNIFSEAQRYAQLQAVMEMKNDPVLGRFFKPEQLVRRALKLLQVPDAEGIANLPKDPEHLDPIEENYNVTQKDSAPLKVYYDQDDVSHLMAHTHFMNSPMFGASPLIAPYAVPALIDHCKDHMMQFYKKHSLAAAESLMVTTPGLTKAEAEAQAVAFADKVMAEILGPMVMPAIQQAYQLSQQLKQQSAPPADPNTRAQVDANKQIAQINSQAQTQVGMAKIQSEEKIKMQEIQQRNNVDQAELQQNAIAAQLAAHSEQMDIVSREREAKMQAALQLMLQEANNTAAQLREEFKANSTQTLMIIQETLKGMIAANAGSPIDIATQVGPALEANSAITGALMSHLKDQEAQNSQDREIMQTMINQTAQDPVTMGISMPPPVLPPPMQPPMPQGMQPPPQGMPPQGPPPQG